ncbi:chemotaxis protein CheW [Aquabacterium sp.]|uniref:chemotaxis protein CheW n=1 Tax=Aquabacterium sp. TaxID=1872578 RepID=UPI003BF60CAE
MNIDNFLPYMRDVVRCESSLRELNLMWRVIEAMAEMNCGDDASGLLPMIAATRQGFESLEKDLVVSLVRQRVDNVMAEVGTQARDVIDIVVRNLYERTADVGFLATDHELCEYAAGLRTDRAAAVDRLRAYRDKYTVYDEIILLDPKGAVLAHIDPQSPIEGSHDPLIRATMDSEGYVETFRPSDLRPGGQPALIYSHRMLHPHTGTVVGVLCLVFGFNTEMEGIFAARHREEGRCNILLLDEHNRVLASADEGWVPRGTKVPVNRSGQADLCIHAGRKYLTQTFAAKGYQGYPGPTGWQGQVMVPLEVAFDREGPGILAQLDEVIAEGLLSHAATFCPPLFEIIQTAETVRRVVWNGEVMAAGDQRDLRALKSVLGQISDNGARSNAVFAQSIRDLYDAALASNLESADFTARLMVDLLDRNLYERANDCRWWAMTPTLQQALSAPALSSADAQHIQQILAYINGLYTVYTQLVVYDRHGQIVAASKPADVEGVSVVGQRIDDAALASTLALRDQQDYHVSAFEPCALYGDRPTYVYHAAIRDPHDQQVVGGIGIVFDAEIEFKAMLKDGLPQQAASQAVYLDRNGAVLSSTDATLPIGSRFALPPDLLKLEKGHSLARVVIRDDQYVVMAACVSNGYREYKVTDGYHNDVLAVCYWPLGEVRTAQLTPARRREAAQLERKMLSHCDQYATFFVDDSLFALPAASVVEALPATELKRLTLEGSQHRIGMLARQREGRIVKYLWVFDLFTLMGLPRCEDRGAQVIVLRQGDMEVGLLVGDLHAVPAFENNQLSSAPAMGAAQGLVSHLIRANAGKLLIQLLDPVALAARLKLETQIMDR